MFTLWDGKMFIGDALYVMIEDYGYIIKVKLKIGY